MKPSVLLLSLTLACAGREGALPARVPVQADTGAGEVPLRVAGRGGAVLMVAAHINGSGPYNLVLDTGATLTCVDEGVARFDDGWAALKVALKNTTEEMLERDYPGHPWRRGDHALAAMLNEVSHHGTQICMVRDIYANRHGAPRQR